MFHFKSRNSGQALVLLALGIVGLIGFTALAIDGGRTFADRRHAQNAADNAAYSGSLRWAKDDGSWSGNTWSNNSWQTPAYEIAGANSYTNDTDSSVSLNIEPYNDCEAIAPTEPVQGALITVEIWSQLNTLFAPVVGVLNTQNSVSATAIACKSYTGHAALGQAAVACNKTECSSFEFGGNNSSTITGSGAFVNSSCDGNGNQKALRGFGSGYVQIPGGISVVGGIDWTMDDPPDFSSAEQIDCFENIIPFENLGIFSCDTNSITNGGPLTDENGKYLEPGRYSGTFPPGQADTVYLKPGTYCIDDDWRTNSSKWEMLMYPGYDYDNGAGVTFVVQGDITINGGALKLKGQNFGEPLDGRLLIYAPFYDEEENIVEHAITINGNSDSSFLGTMFAPTADITLDGTANNEKASWVGQVIGDTIKVTGTVDWNLIYNDEVGIDVVNSPTISMEK